jgi:hypothetical protein
MTGPVEEGAKLAGGFMDVLRGQPLSLALVVMNIALLVVFWVILNTVADQRKREVEMMYSEARSVREQLTTALQKCGAVQQRTLLRLPPLPPVPISAR